MKREFKNHNQNLCGAVYKLCTILFKNAYFGRKNIDTSEIQGYGH